MGVWSIALRITTSASRPGPGIPPSSGFTTAAAVTTPAAGQVSHASFSREYTMTSKRGGMSSDNLAGFMPNADLARATDRADSQFRFYRNLYLSARKTRRKSHPLGFGLWPRLSFRVRGRFSFRIPLGGDGFLQGFFPKLQLGAPELLRSALRAPAQHRLELSREHRLVPHQSGNEREDEIDRLLHSFGRPHPHEEVTKDAEVLGTGLRLGMGKKLRHTPRSHDPTGETTGLLSDFCQLL
jgi:hypothetical protein